MGRSKQWCACACGYGWAWHQQVANGEDTRCAICGRSWAKQIAKKKKEKEAKAEQASWKVPGWPMWPASTGGGNQGPKAELGKVSSALAEVWQDLPEATQKALTKVGCKATRLPSPPPGLRVPSSLQGSMTQQEYQAARTVVYSGAGDHVQKLLAAAGIPPPEDANLDAPEITPGQRLTRVVTEFRKSTNQMQKLVKKRAMLQAKADSLKEELEALMLDVAQVGREIENKDAEMKDTAREFKELTEDKATTFFGQMEQVLAEAGHELAEGTKAKLKAALLTTTAEDEIGPDPFLSRFESREPFPQELAGINQGPTVWMRRVMPRQSRLGDDGWRTVGKDISGFDAGYGAEGRHSISRRLEGCPGQWFNFGGLECQVVAWQTQAALMSGKPSEPDILSLVEKLENTLDDGSLEHWVCHHILDALSSSLFSREMWYVAVQAVQEVLNTSDPGVSRKLTCITANVTQWRKEVATWLFELGPDVAAVQETHLDQTEIRQVQIEAGKAGYQFQALPAGQGKGVGTLGGVAILTKNHLGARLVDSFVTKEGCGWIAVALRVHGRDLILFSLYLQSGVGPTGGCSPEVLASLASTLSQLQGVWVVMGDFNHPRLEMANFGLVTQVKGKL
ncbi:unnamed protein product, partial [Symbiodinium necroappetens]